MDAKKILKSIHVLSHLSVHLLDRDFNIVASHTAGSALFMKYDTGQLAREAEQTDHGFSLINGHFRAVHPV